MTAAAKLVAGLTRRFAAAGIDSARTDARCLVAFALKVPPVRLRMTPEIEADGEAVRRIEEYAARRLKREPVSKILGTRGFWRLEFKVTPDVLDPRPDSETLIEKVLEYFPDRRSALQILDLGTGSGCLALSLLSEYPDASAAGTDVSEKALAVAEENARVNGLSGCDNEGNRVFEIEGTALLHTLSVYDDQHNEIFKMTKKIVSVLPTYQFYYLGELYGTLEKKFVLVKNKFEMKVKEGKLELTEYAGSIGHNFCVTLNGKTLGTILDNLDLKMENIVFDNAVIIAYEEKYLPLLAAMAVMVARELARDRS